jgi:nucleotide-binding universal stress UspA family protein
MALILLHHRRAFDSPQRSNSMSKRFMDPKGKILVAINFDAQTPRLLELARALSARTGLGVKLIHVVEPTLRDAYPGTLDLTGAIRDAADEIDENNIKDARERLFAYERDFFPAKASSNGDTTADKRWPTVERVALIGQPAEAIVAEATLNGAALILCGAGPKHQHFLPKGFSTALSLMTHAPCSVMVQGVECSRDVLRAPTKLMIADDMGQAGEEATITGLDLARALGNTDVLHITVGPTSQNWFIALKERLAMKEKNHGALDAHELLTGVTAELDKKLRTRAPEHVALLATRGGHYETRVMHGRDVPQEVFQASKDFGADIVVYGRHRLLHRDPWTLGKIPWSDMLDTERLVVVAGHM